MIRLILFLTVLIAGYCAYPFFTIWQIERALQNRDAVAMESLVDWNTLRAGIKSDLSGEIMRRTASEFAKQDGASALGAALGAALVDRMIDGLVSPKFFFNQADQHTIGKMRPLREFITYAFFVSPTEFRVDLQIPDVPSEVPKITALMSLTGASWKVTRVTLPFSLFKDGIQGTGKSDLQVSPQAVPTAALSLDELEQLRAQMQACWRPLEGKGALEIIRVRVQLNQDGTLKSDPTVMSAQSTSVSKAAADRALIAIRRCQPYSMPQSKYDAWRDVEITFDPR